MFADAARQPRSLRHTERPWLRCVASSTRTLWATLLVCWHSNRDIPLLLTAMAAEPDRSNPTRSRWERPLDTIRSFEAAIDGGYSNRRSMLRSDTESVAGWGNSRRQSQ